MVATPQTIDWIIAAHLPNDKKYNTIGLNNIKEKPIANANFSGNALILSNIFSPFPRFYLSFPSETFLLYYPKQLLQTSVFFTIFYI